MAGIFRKALGSRQNNKLASEKTGSDRDRTAEDGQTDSANVDLIARFKTLKQDIQVAASGED